jgi:Skp family chaperone for outer membrane proteins
MGSHAVSLRRSSAFVAVSSLVLAGLAGLTPATAQDSPAPVSAEPSTAAAQSTRVAPERRKPIPAGQCVRDGGVLGIASLGGKRLEGGKVSVLTPPSKGGWFTTSQRLKGTTRTNAAGGFYVAAGCLPEFFVVTVTGGTLDGEPFTGTISTLGRASEPAVIVTPVTTVAVQYARANRGVSLLKSVSRVKKYFGVVDYGPRLVDLGMGSRVVSSAFDPVAFMAAADGAGGLKAFTGKLAGRVASGKVRSFKPMAYVADARPGYAPAPDGPSDGSALTSSVIRPRGGLSSTLSSIAGKAAVAETCKLLGPSIASDLAGVCPPDYSSALDAINQSLVRISQQLDELQESVDEIIVMLDAMQVQLNDIQTTVNKILQQQLKTEAQAAQEAYATAYNYSSATEISALVNQAAFDVMILGSLPLVAEDTWPTVPSGASVEDKCLTTYSKYNITSGAYAGQNPLALCKDYQYRTSGLFDNSTYNMKLYKALTGAGATPQGDLLPYNQQQALTSGANAPVKQELLKQAFDQMGQLGQLMDIGYAMYAAWQMFEYAVTTGDTVACPNLTVSGSFPANTAINTSSACNTLQSGLFTASVQNQVAGKVTVTPAGSVADPRNNYVWWGYPVDVSGTTYNSTYFPLYPSDDGSNPYNPVFDFAKGYNTQANMYGYMLQALRGAMWYAYYPAGAQPIPLLKGYTQADFGMPTSTEMLTLLTDLPLASGQTYANALGAMGFRGVGGTSFGVNWSNLATNTQVEWFFSKYTNQPWTSNTTGPVGSCPGWPWSSTNSVKFDWQIAAPVAAPYTGTCSGFAPLARNAWNLASTTAPTSSNAPACTTNMVNPGSAPKWIRSDIFVCTQDTFALLLNNQYRSPSATSGGWTPPFYQAAMLTGPSSSGVPALPLS